jgi:hypothetical protein
LALEAEVDRLVYTLYGLTAEEIKVVKLPAVVENSTSAKARSFKRGKRWV